MTLQPLRSPRRMTPTDALFWYAESALPTLRPIIGGLHVLDRAADPEQIEAGHDVTLALVPRLRQRVVEVPLHLGLPEWTDDPHFDRAYHVRHLSLPAPGSLRQLLDLTATLLATPLDRQRPLWEAYWIDGVADARSAYFLKMHHALVDGVGSLAILNALTQRDRAAGVPHVPAAPPRSAPAPPGTARRLAGVAMDGASEIARLARWAASSPAGLAMRPRESASELWRMARGLRGNDLILAVLAGALGTYHRERGVAVPALNCMVPMSLRGEDELSALGNRVGMFSIVLPVGEQRRRRRIELITKQTAAAKTDKRGSAAPFLVRALILLPGIAFRWLARQSLGRVNLCCTNIPGVRERRYMAGAEVEAIYPFASVVEGTPLVVALLSYAGSMDIGIDTDPEAIPDPHRIAELFTAGLDEMAAVASHTAYRREDRRRQLATQ